MGQCCPKYPEEGDSELKKVSVGNIKRKAQSGDIFVGAGRGQWSDVVKAMSESWPWSHVGIFYRDSAGDLYVFDSDTSGGVKLTDFDTYVQGYGGYCVGYRVLVVGTNRKRFTRDVITMKLEKFIRENSGKPYQTDMRVLGNSITRENEEEYRDAYFCTQLVIDAYKYIGLVATDTELSVNSKLIDFIYDHGDVWFCHEGIYFGCFCYTELI